MSREINQFKCQDEDGVPYTVIEYQNYTTFTSLDNGRRQLPSSKEYFLPDGNEVSPLDADTFKIVRTDTIIRKITS